MARQFQPPTQIRQAPTKEEALLAPITQTVQTLPALFAQYKLQRMQQDMALKEQQFKQREFESRYGTGVAENMQPGQLLSAPPPTAGAEEQLFGFEATPPTFTEETPEQKLRRMGTEGFGAETNRIKAEREPVTGKAKPPTGFRFTAEGDLEAIPGGPADFKQQETNSKKAQMKSGAISQANRIIEKVDQALAKVSGGTTGLIGKFTRAIPGTKSKNLSSDLTTIKANLGFAELQAMRQASPTGGALGQVAVQELEALQSTLASLDQDQGPEQLKARLGEIRTHYENWKRAVEEAEGASGQSEVSRQSGVQENDPLGIR